MINNKDLNKIVEDCRVSGVNITVRDISYSLLCRFYEDKKVSYKIAFGVQGAVNEHDFDSYDKSREVAFINAYMDSNYPNNNIATKKKSKEGEDISFEENKAYMLKLKRDTEKAMEDGTIETKDALKILTDISTKLNDKFQVSADVKDQIVVVEQKYDYVCPYCNHEVARRPMTKEEAIKEYNLIENDNNRDK